MITNSEFNQKLIDVLKERLPDRSEQLNLMMDLFSLGKEAAYRRLRGDVPFSFTEACIISEKLGISLDNVMGMAVCNHKILYELETPPTDLNTIVDFNEYYHNVVYNEHWRAFEKLYVDSSMEFISAYNTIPHSMLLSYPNLLRFRAFKWAYQMYRGTFSEDLSKFNFNKSAEKKLKDLSQKLNNCNVTFIFGRQVFMSFIRQIQHFRQLNFLSDENLILIKQELLDLISFLENTAVQGESPGGKKVWLYLSNLDFESNYTYMKSDNFEISFMHLYQVHTVISTDTIACRMSREWIESLKKYSTLISISGEMERILFFEAQRKAVNEYCI